MARSNEAKKLGIKAGTPYFQLKDLFPGQEIAVFSSNYELYLDMTDRVMSLVRQEVPAFYRYSIDEGFCMLKGMERFDLKAWGEQLHKTIKHSTGMPVSIGIGPTKTLAKMASHYAKHYPGYNHCCYIDTDEKRIKALKLYPIDEVWGIGRQYTKRLQAVGVQTAYDFASMSRSWVRLTFNVVVERTWRELNGDDCVPIEDMSKKKSICTSRSFPSMVSDFETLRTSISNFAAHCAEKLRRQQSAASIVSVFIDTNHFREDLPQYHCVAPRGYSNRGISTSERALSLQASAQIQPSRPTSLTTIPRNTRRRKGLMKPSTASIVRMVVRPSCLGRNNIQQRTEKAKRAFSATASSTTSAVPATPQSGAIFLKQNKKVEVAHFTGNHFDRFLLEQRSI